MLHYDPCFTAIDPEALIREVPWTRHTEARQECFMSTNPGETYTYGVGRGTRTYTATEFTRSVGHVLRSLNAGGVTKAYKGFNVCFLNLYANQHQHLGWHADDSPGMDHEHAIAVVSLGEPRELWWRAKGASGVVPAAQRVLLASGSLLVMPPGFQLTHQHRIPKGERAMGARASLTFRRYVPPSRG